MGLFDFAVNFAVGDCDACIKYVRFKFEDEEFEDDSKGYAPRGKCFFKAGYVPIIWIPRVPKTPREYGTLSHECFHALMHMHDWASVPVGVESTEEVTAHALAHLVTKALEKMK